MLTIEPHPLLDLAAFVTDFPAPLGELTTSQAIQALLSSASAAPAAPLTADEAVRTAVRALLRHGGYKPTGRGKPASEYLVRAHAEGSLGAINPAVDACNAVSLHSGLPVSVVDLDRLTPPLRVALAPAGARYVFNAAGQEIDLEGLLCLFDADGPCANAVKDAQRTKTHVGTRRTLSLVWGTRALPGRTAQAVAWYRSLLEAMEARTAPAE
ncbi:MAG TPA: phenylalanine--tRNA ligase beta subunit-related protein [Polyangia bacterium]|jgi:DNA/RNA-binding domain of Phe-tRNA-synthetase-like protein|nr:phenylalanine--tRNA ligase beta subunit-related protein [Polyangia bacterium]